MFAGSPVPVYRVQSRTRGRKRWQTHLPGSIALARVRGDGIRWAIDNPSREYRIIRQLPEGQTVEATIDEQGNLRPRNP